MSIDTRKALEGEGQAEQSCIIQCLSVSLQTEGHPPIRSITGRELLKMLLKMPHFS